LWIGGIGFDSSTPTLGTILNSFSAFANAAGTDTANQDSKVYALERIVTATGTASSGGTLSASGNWSGTIATFKAVSLTLGGAAAGNYTLSGLSGSVTITPQALSVTAPTIASKVYDGTATAGAVTVGTLSGFVGTETVTATGTAAAYSSKNVGSYPNVVVTYTLANGANGGLAANYSLANGTATGTISAKTLSVTAPSITSKVYDATTAAGAVTVGTLSGFVGTETVTATATAAAYSSANVGSYTGDVVTYTLANGTGGGLAGNYTLATGTATGQITAKALSVTAPSIASK